MAEVLGKLIPDADTTMLTPFDALTDLEQAQVSLATAKGIAKELETVDKSAGYRSAGKFIVALEDGRVTTSTFGIYIGNQGE